MPRYLNHADLQGNQLQNAVMHRLAADPGSPATALMWFHDTAGGDSQGRLKIKLGTRTMTIDDQYVAGVSVTGPITNGGTALAPNIQIQAAATAADGYMSQAHWNLLNSATDSATNGAIVKRDGSGNASFNMVTINNAPVSNTDAVNKLYADSIAAGWDPKGSCTLATVGALPACVYANGTAGVGATLTASANAALTQTMIDGGTGYTVIGGERVLIKNQVTAFQNGIYTVTQVGSAGTPWVLTRATDFNTATAGPGQVSSGAFLFVEGGTNATTQWIMSTFGAVTMGTTSLTFTQFGAGSTYTNGAGISLAGNTFSVNLTAVNTLETSSGALRVKSSANTGAPLLSAGTGNEAAYGALNLAGGANVISGILPKANGGLGVDASTGLTANYFLAAPNGSSGAASFRAMVNADLPTSGITAGAWTKPTFNDRGIATGGANLAATDIPVLDFAKITTGIVPTTQGGTGVNLANIKNVAVPNRAPVRVVVTTNISVAAPGASLDSVAMAAGDRVLLTGQTTASQNGLWVWNSSGGAMTRPLDFPAAGASQAYYGVNVEVLAGTLHAGTCWFLSTAGAITIDTTSIAFTQMAFNLGDGITGIVPVANGGTGASTAAAARTALSAAGVYPGTITGDNTTVNFVVTHNLNSAVVSAKVTDPLSNNLEVFPDIEYTSVNTCTVKFAVAPANAVVFNVRCEG